MKLIAAIIAIFAVLVTAGRRARKRQVKGEAERKSRAGLLLEQTREFMTRIQDSGTFTPLVAVTLNLRAGEFAILNEVESNLLGFETGIVASGRTLFYPASWKLESDQKLTKLATGDLYLTNQRLVFVAESRSFQLTWANLLSIRATLAGITLHTNDAPTPIDLSVRNAVLWAILIRWMGSGEVKSPELEQGTQIEIEADEMKGFEQLIRVRAHQPH